MKGHWLRGIGRAFLLLPLLVVLGTGCAIHIEPAYGPIIENRLGETVVIYVRAFERGRWDAAEDRGEIPPGTKRFVFAVAPPSSQDKKYELEAKTADGRTVWKRVYTRQEIVDMQYPLVIEKPDVTPTPSP